MKKYTELVLGSVERELLTDYKVLILTLNDKMPPAVQRMISTENMKSTRMMLPKSSATINALSKQFLGDDGITKEADPEPMKRGSFLCEHCHFKRFPPPTTPPMKLI